MLRLFGRRAGKEREQLHELLSAYLDGELSDVERQRFEARLSQDAELRAELRAMRRTVSLVSELPQVAAPRNFILSESMVRERRPAAAAPAARPEPQRGARAWAAPLLTAATAVVSLLFVIVLAGDLLLPGVGGIASAPAPMRPQGEVPEIALEAAPSEERPQAEVDTEEEAAVDIASPSAVPTDTMLRESPEEPEMAIQEEAVATEDTKADQAPAGAEVTPSPAGGGGPPEEIAALAAPTEVPAVTSMAALTPTIPAEEPVVSEGELGLVEPTAEELEVTPQLVREEQETDRAKLPPLPWSVLEVALGLAALVLVVATVQAWRMRQR